MSIAFVAGAKNSPGSVSTYPQTLPAGFNSAGNMTVIGCITGIGQAITVPSGWTTVFNANGCAVVYRFWQSGDPSSVSFTVGTAEYGSTAAATYSGVDSSNPIDVSNATTIFASTAGSSSYTGVLKVPSLNPTFNNDWLVLFAGDPYIVAAALSAPSGYTSRESNSGGGSSSILCDQAITGGTNTGEINITCSSTGGLYRTGVVVALKASGSTSATLASPVATLTGMGVLTNNGVTSGAPTLINPQNGD